jgi:hypothetical protein
MNLSKRTIILLLIGVLAIVAAVMSARNDEDPEDDIIPGADAGPEDDVIPDRVIVPEAEPADEPAEKATTYKGSE